MHNLGEKLYSYGPDLDVDIIKNDEAMNSNDIAPRQTVVPKT